MTRAEPGRLLPCRFLGRHPGRCGPPAQGRSARPEGCWASALAWPQQSTVLGKPHHDVGVIPTGSYVPIASWWRTSH